MADAVVAIGAVGWPVRRTRYPDHQIIIDAADHGRYGATHAAERPGLPT